MKVRISDILKLDIFSGAELIAGSPYAGNRVSSVSVMDSDDPEVAAIENGVKDQLVLTSFRSCQDDSVKARMIRRIANAGVSGIVIFHKNKKDISAKLISEAEAMGIPLISFRDPKGLEYSDVISGVMGMILNGDSREHDLITNTVYHLLDFEKHASFPEALKEAAIKSAFQVVLLSGDLNPILVVETRKRATVADVVRYGKDKKVGQEGGFKFLDVNGLLTYWAPVTVQGEKHFILIVDNNDSYSAQEIAKLAEIIELAMGMWRYTPERDVRSEFIRALMRDNKSLAYSLRDELDIDPEAILSVYYAKGTDDSLESDIISKYEKNAGIKFIRLNDGDETNALIIRAGGKADSKNLTVYKRACLEFFDDLRSAGKTVRIFHATGLGGVEGAGDAFRLINETWPYVESVFPYKKVFTKYEFALVSDCINLQVGGGYQKKNYMDLLEPFHREVGENKANQLLETLETFVLDAGMNASKTSELMGIHANTVQYRLKRINEVLGAEITGNRVIPGLTIALALKRLERVVR